MVSEGQWFRLFDTPSKSNGLVDLVLDRRSLLLNGLTSYDPAILIAGKEDWS
jgi:hypothetical protein